MPIGASGAEAKIDDEQFPSLGGRAAARSEQSWGGGSRGTKPWDSTGRSGQTAWRAKVAAPRVRTQRFGTEKSDEPAPRGHQTVPDPPHGYSDYHRASNRSHSGRNERVCCHFLEQGHCSHGKNCRFNHSRDVDPAWTLCGFGNGCKFNHGRKLASYREEGKERDAARGCQNARACCRFLEGNCPNGARCKYRHDEGCDKSSTLCGYGVHCEFGHGTSITEATDTDGYDNPLVCCNWLQFGRCINGPACNYRHERAFDPKRTRCGFGKLCKFGHGLDMTYEQWESPYRAFQEGHWSRDGTNAAHSAKEPDRNAVKHSTISAAPKASLEENDADVSPEDYKKAPLGCSGAWGAAKKNDVSPDDYPELGGQQGDSKGAWEKKSLGCPGAWGTAKKITSPETDVPEVLPLLPDSWEEEERWTGSSKAPISDARQDDVQKLFVARDTAAEDIIGALEQAWEDVWSTSVPAAPADASEDASAANPESIFSATATPTCGSMIKSATAVTADGQEPDEKQPPCSSVAEKPRKPAASAAQREQKLKQLPSWLARPRRVRSKDKESGKQPVASTIDPASSADKGKEAAAILPEVDVKYATPDKEQGSSVDKECEGEDAREKQDDAVQHYIGTPDVQAHHYIGTPEAAAHPNIEVTAVHHYMGDTEEDPALATFAERRSRFESPAEEDIDDLAEESAQAFCEKSNILKDGSAHVAQVIGSGQPEAEVATATGDEEDDAQDVGEGTGQSILKQQAVGADTLVGRCIREEVACCHFLRGWCQWGSNCHYRHEWGLDPTCTECEYGENCVHGHGWATFARQRYSMKHSEQDPSPNNAAESQLNMADFPEVPRRQAFFGDRVHDRACCLFLEYAVCPSGNRCPFKHVLTDPARTLCNYGSSGCRHEHGWALFLPSPSQAKAVPPLQSKELAMSDEEQAKSSKPAATDTEDEQATDELGSQPPLPCVNSSEVQSTQKEEEQNVLKTSTSINKFSDSKAKRGRACCHFLQHWYCRNGRLCQYQHVRCDTRLTLCGYGTEACQYGHGWEREDQSELRQQLAEKLASAATGDPLDAKQSDLQSDEKMVKGEDSQNAWDKSDGTENLNPHRESTESRASERICCYFLQFRKCAMGDACKYKHVKDDTATTVCGFGKDACRYSHGWARGLQLPPKVIAADPKSETDSENRVCSRVCRNFLDGASGRRGSPTRKERTHGDRATWVGGGDAAAGVCIPNAPTKLLRTALTGLLGWWHSAGPGKTMQCHMVTLRFASGGRGSGTLVCVTTAKCEETHEPISVEGGDIVLGTKRDYFLDSSSNRFVTWVHKNKRELTRRWTRGWAEAADTQDASGEDSEEVLLGKAIQFQ